MRTKQGKLKRAARKTVKWGGAGVTVLLAVLWIGSAWWMVGWIFADGDRYYVLSGQMGVYLRATVDSSVKEAEGICDRAPLRLHWWFDSRQKFTYQAYSIPLWPPFLLSLLATAAAWRSDAKHLRRAREGTCLACGYDRAGLAPGAVCPECGAAANA